MLRVKSVELPADGWGRVHVTEADIWHDQPGEPKTGPRTVPIPPVLVGMLRTWIVEQALIADDQLLFRTTRHHAGAVELGTSVATSSPIDRATTAPGLRLPTRSGHHLVAQRASPR